MKKAFHSIASLPDLQDELNMAVKLFEAENALPPMLLTLPPSVELEPLMQGLCLELEEAKLVRFTGDKHWLNIKLEYIEGHPDFPSFSHMLQSLHMHAGYRNDFSGVVRIDLTALMEHVEDKRFSDLLAFIYDYSDDIFFIASVTTNDARRADPLKKEFSRWMYTLTVDVAPPDVALLTKNVEKKLTAAGHTLSADARALLRESVEHLAALDDFAGMREIESLSKAIVVRTAAYKKISAKHLEYFAPDGQWMARRMGTEKITIGFGGGMFNEK